MNENFIKHYMGLAEYVSKSKVECLSRGVGAVIVDPEANRVVSTGVNGPSTGVPHPDSYDFLHDYVWPQLSESDLEKLVYDAHLKYKMDLHNNKVIREQYEEAFFSCARPFAQGYQGCGTCPRKLVGAKSGERLELCQCLTFSSQILMSDGSWTPIGRIVESGPTGMVKSYNIKEGRVENKNITGLYKIPRKKNGKIYSIITKDFPKGKRGDVEASQFTADHKILTKKGYKRIDRVSVGDKIIAPLMTFAHGRRQYDEIIEIGRIQPRPTETQFVYCIDVEDNHNFFTLNAIAKNCRHGESNAIVRSGRDLRGFWMFCACGVPCAECAGDIIEAGIKRVYCWSDDEAEAYKSFKSEWLFRKAGVELIRVDRNA